jgi:hypothetical protein
MRRRVISGSVDVVRGIAIASPTAWINAAGGHRNDIGVTGISLEDPDVAREGVHAGAEIWRNGA